MTEKIKADHYFNHENISNVSILPQLSTVYPLTRY